MNKTTRIVKILGDIRQGAQRDLDQFQSTFHANPLHALSWSARAFEQANRQEVATTLLNAINDPGVDLKLIHNLLQRDLLLRARSPEAATSPTHNLAERYRLAAVAEILERLQPIFEADETSEGGA